MWASCSCPQPLTCFDSIYILESLAQVLEFSIYLPGLGRQSGPLKSMGRWRQGELWMRRHAFSQSIRFLKKKERNKTQLAKIKKEIRLYRLALLAAFSHNYFADIVW